MARKKSGYQLVVTVAGMKRCKDSDVAKGPKDLMYQRRHENRIPHSDVPLVIPRKKKKFEEKIVPEEVDDEASMKINMNVRRVPRCVPIVYPLRAATER